MPRSFSSRATTPWPRRRRSRSSPPTPNSVIGSSRRLGRGEERREVLLRSQVGGENEPPQHHHHLRCGEDGQGILHLHGVCGGGELPLPSQEEKTALRPTDSLCFPLPLQGPGICT